MKEFMDSYLSVTPAFKSLEPSLFKKSTFEYNHSRHFPADRGSYMLDIGPGRGEMLSLWEEKGYKNIFAVDISKEVVDLCSRSVKSAHINLVDDIRDFLQRHPKKFDFISMLDVIEHLPDEDLLAFAQDIHGALKEGGTLVVQTCNAASPTAALNEYSDITHKRSFTELALAQWLSFPGFAAYKFFPLEEPIVSIKGHIRMGLRWLYYKWIYFVRLLEHSHNPKILTPVFFVVAHKGKKYENRNRRSPASSKGRVKEERRSLSV